MPVGLVDVGDRRGADVDARVVEGDVEAAELLDGEVDHGRAVGCSGHVGANEFGVGAELLGGLCRCLAGGDVHVRQHQASAFCSES